MTIVFKPTETFHDDFTYRNSDAAILRFPFPFAEDAYMYSVNIEPHVPADPRRPTCTPSTLTNIMSPNAASGRACWRSILAAAKCCHT